jgi:hypothetical protein
VVTVAATATTVAMAVGVVKTEAVRVVGTATAGTAVGGDGTSHS